MEYVNRMGHSMVRHCTMAREMEGDETISENKSLPRDVLNCKKKLFGEESYQNAEAVSK